MPDGGDTMTLYGAVVVGSEAAEATWKVIGAGGPIIGVGGAVTGAGGTEAMSSRRRRTVGSDCRVGSARVRAATVTAYVAVSTVAVAVVVIAAIVTATPSDVTLLPLSAAFGVIVKVCVVYIVSYHPFHAARRQ